VSKINLEDVQGSIGGVALFRFLRKKESVEIGGVAGIEEAELTGELSTNCIQGQSEGAA